MLYRPELAQDASKGITPISALSITPAIVSSKPPETSQARKAVFLEGHFTGFDASGHFDQFSFLLFGALLPCGAAMAGVDLPRWDDAGRIKLNLASDRP